MKTSKEHTEQGTPIRVGRQKRPAESKLRVLRGAMVAICGMILVMGLLLTILPLFRISGIIIEGNSYYSTEEILAYAGIAEGDEWLAIDGQKIADAIRSKGQYIDRVTVSGEFPLVVRISIEEKNVMYTAHNGSYYAFDDTFTVLASSKNEKDFSSFLYVELPEIRGIEVGYAILFERADMDMGYISVLRNTLSENGLLAHTTKLDCSKKYNVSAELGGTLRLTLGKVSDLTAKLTLAEKILEERKTEGTCYISLDVSDMQKSTYRIMSEADFLANG
ncbi:MAG: FtsQ-type POTRA domain-containing protein [Clostridia bacterium]|nr:FtsQ-type POTRA domain-containing protein [Clostridia bacterium]